MKNQDISQFATGANYHSNLFQPIIKPLMPTNLVDNLYDKNIFDNVVANIETRIINNKQIDTFSNSFFNTNSLNKNTFDILGNFPNLLCNHNDLTKPLGLNFLDYETGIFSTLPNVVKDITPISIYSANNIFSTNNNENSSFGKSFLGLNNFSNSTSSELSNSLPTITSWNWTPALNIFDSLDNSISVLVSNPLCNDTSSDFLKFDNLFKDFKPISLINTELNLFKDFYQKPIFSLSSLNSFGQLLYSNLHTNQINKKPTSQEILNYLQSNSSIIICSSSSNDLQMLFNDTTIHSFNYSMKQSAVVIQINIPDQNVADYNELIITENYKKKQGKGGGGKRRAEQEFFISKFIELKNLYPKSTNREILLKIWNDHQSTELKNISKLSGTKTLFNWMKKIPVLLP